MPRATVAREIRGARKGEATPQGCSMRILQNVAVRSFFCSGRIRKLSGYPTQNGLYLRRTELRGRSRVSAQAKELGLLCSGLNGRRSCTVMHRTSTLVALLANRLTAATEARKRGGSLSTESCSWEGAQALDDELGVDGRRNGSECRQMMEVSACSLMLPRLNDKRRVSADRTPQS